MRKRFYRDCVIQATAFSIESKICSLSTIWVTILANRS